MSNYNEVADRLDSERLPASLGDRQLAARVLRFVATASADAEIGFVEWEKFAHLKPCAMNEHSIVLTSLKQAYLAGHVAATASRQAEVETLRTENETLCMTIAACDVGAMSNTSDSAASQRLPKSSPYWRSALQSVYDAVDREMKLRDDLDTVCREVERLDNLIVHLGEYWNGNENERAMADMCWHVISECDKAKADRPVRVMDIMERWKEQQL